MVKKTLKIGTSIFVLSASLVCSGFQGKPVSAEKDDGIEEDQVQTDNDKECSGICYNPKSEAGEYYIANVHPEKYEKWTKEHDAAIIYEYYSSTDKKFSARKDKKQSEKDKAN